MNKAPEARDLEAPRRPRAPQRCLEVPDRQRLTTAQQNASR